MSRKSRSDKGIYNFEVIQETEAEPELTTNVLNTKCIPKQEMQDDFGLLDMS